MRSFIAAISVLRLSRAFTTFRSNVRISWSTWRDVSEGSISVSAGGAAAGAAAGADGGGSCGALFADGVVTGVVACCWLGFSGVGVLLFCAIVWSRGGEGSGEYDGDPFATVFGVGLGWGVGKVNAGAAAAGDAAVAGGAAVGAPLSREGGGLLVLDVPGRAFLPLRARFTCCARCTFWRHLFCNACLFTSVNEARCAWKFTFCGLHEQGLLGGSIRARCWAYGRCFLRGTRVRCVPGFRVVPIPILGLLPVLCSACVIVAEKVDSCGPNRCADLAEAYSIRDRCVRLAGPAGLECCSVRRGTGGLTCCRHWAAACRLSASVKVARGDKTSNIVKALIFNI